MSGWGHSRRYGDVRCWREAVIEHMRSLKLDGPRDGSISRDYHSLGALIWLQSTPILTKKLLACRVAGWLAGYAELDGYRRLDAGMPRRRLLVRAFRDEA
jgi:hypothetical protein